MGNRWIVALLILSAAARGFAPRPAFRQPSAALFASMEDVGDCSWIKKTSPPEVSFKKEDTENVEYYDVSISGKWFQTGEASKRIYEPMSFKSRFGNDEGIDMAFRAFSMSEAATEAVRKMLKRSGIEMLEKQVFEGDEEVDTVPFDIADWEGIDSITFENEETGEKYPECNSIEESIAVWVPGQTFSFVARKVPVKATGTSGDDVTEDESASTSSQTSSDETPESPLESPPEDGVLEGDDGQSVFE